METTTTTNSSVASIFSYNDNNVTFRTKNGYTYVNATEMSKSFSKKPDNWLRTKPAIRYINAIENSVSHISDTEKNNLVVVVQGGDPRGQGTWMHESIALAFSQWLSPEFHVWCNQRIKELLTVGITALPQTIDAMLDNPDLLIELLTKLKETRASNAILSNSNKALEETNISLTNNISILTNKIDSFTISVAAKQLGIRSSHVLNKILVDNKILIKTGSDKAAPSYQPYPNYVDWFNTVVLPIQNRNNGNGGVVRHLKINQYGFNLLRNLLIDKGIIIGLKTSI